MEVLSQAKVLGAVLNSDSLCLPAGSLLTFLREAINEGFSISYVECLYFHEQDGDAPAGTEPSMELSRDAGEFSSSDLFLAELGSIVPEAIVRASRRNIRAFFQIGINPEPNWAGSGIKIRR